MTEITAHQRMTLAAIVDRIVYGRAETFYRQDAIDLLAYFPPQTLMQKLGNIFQLRIKGSMPRSGLEGHTGAQGTVKMEDEKNSFDVGLDGRRFLRAGQWKIHRADSLWRKALGQSGIVITQVMNEESEDRPVVVNYSFGEPTNVTSGVPATLHLGFLIITHVKDVHWKSPVDGQYEGESYEISAGSDRSPFTFAIG